MSNGVHTAPASQSLVWVVEQSLDVILCVAIVPSPEGEGSHRVSPRARTQGATRRGRIIESVRARKRTRYFSDRSKHDYDTLPLPVKCLVWGCRAVSRRDIVCRKCSLT